MSAAALSPRMTGTPATAKWMTWTGRALSGLFVLFMIFDIGIKLAGLPIVAETMVRLGWPAELGRIIGIIELAILILYLVPSTAVLGAVLMTGMLGGAVATHVRVADPLLTHALFGVYLGLFCWGGLWLRDARLRAIFPIRRPAHRDAAPGRTA